MRSSCAWCDGGSDDPDVNHTICERHLREFYPPRPFSGGVALTFAIAGLFVVCGLLLAAFLEIVR